MKILELYAEDIYVQIGDEYHPVGEYLAYEDEPFTPLLDENGYPYGHDDLPKLLKN
jgi:hypothetical protein